MEWNECVNECQSICIGDGQNDQIVTVYIFTQFDYEKFSLIIGQTQLMLMIECVTKRHSSNLLQLKLTMDAALNTSQKIQIILRFQVLCEINMFALCL